MTIFAKPVRAKEIEEVLMRWTSPGKMGTSVQPEGITVLKTPEAKQQFDGDDLIDHLMGNKELARRIAARFLDSMPQLLAALARGLDSFDAPATRIAAHSIKGAAANVGTAVVRDVASKLEGLGETRTLDSAPEVFLELAATFELVRPAIKHFSTGTL